MTVETVAGGKIITKVGEARVPLRELANKVRVLLKDRTNKGVEIEAPGTTDYDSIVQVIDEVKAGGAEPIVLGLKSP